MGWKFSDSEIIEAMANVSTLTKMIGRWQTINKNPLTITDAAHNEDGIRQVVQQLATMKYNYLHIVLGMAKDKDQSKILQLLPKNALYYFCKPDVPRGLKANLLAEKAAEFGLKGEVYDSVNEALRSATGDATDEDLIFVGGSSFVVAEVV